MIFSFFDFDCVVLCFVARAKRRVLPSASPFLPPPPLHPAVRGTRAARGETESRAGVNPPAPHWKVVFVVSMALPLGPQALIWPRSDGEACLRAKTGNFIPGSLVFLHEVDF